MRIKAVALTFLLISLAALVACGGGSSSTTTSQSNASTAQGVYRGTSVSGSTTSTFEAIILPNDRFYAIYGPDAGDGSFFVDGFMTGQGSSRNGTYTVSSLADYLFGSPTRGSLSATFVAGSSVNGTITEAGLASTFSGTPVPASTFNYNTPASMSALTGIWTGGVIDGSMPISSVNVSANGSFSGGWTGCSYSGSATPNLSKNFFDISMRFQGSGCLLDGQTATGTAVVTNPSTGGSQVIVAIATPTYGTVFLGTK